MLKKVNVKIAVGTYSYIMGGSELIDLKDNLPESLKEKVHFEGTIEIDGCNECAGSRPPFASVNGKVIEQANREKIIKAIESELRK